MSYRLSQLAEYIGARLEGDPHCEIDNIATLQNAKPGSISFLSNYRYRRYLQDTKASAVILSEAILAECPVAALVTDNPYLAYAKIAELLADKPERKPPGIHRSAIVDSSADIDATASIGPFCVVEQGVHIGAEAVLGPSCVIGRNSKIGARTHLVSGVTICPETIIGKNCNLLPGAVIGGDGFGLAQDNGKWVKIQQFGRVIIGNDVDIGANTTIDRGALDDTVIEDGVKLDNHIQIGHNVRIGAHTVIAGCVGIAGSANIGAYCTIGGAAGISGHIKIADHVTITAYSRVGRTLRKPGSYTSGTPLEPTRDWQKNSARLRHLDEIARRLAILEKKLKD